MISWLPARRAKWSIVGDFDDEPTAPAEDDVFAAWSREPQRYAVLTQNWPTRVGIPTLPALPSRRLIDQIIVSSSLGSDYEGGHTRVIDFDQLLSAYDYERVVSDHLPVVAVFPLQKYRILDSEGCEGGADAELPEVETVVRELEPRLSRPGLVGARGLRPKLAVKARTRSWAVPSARSCVWPSTSR